MNGETMQKILFHHRWMASAAFVALAWISMAQSSADAQLAPSVETAAQTRQRHERVAERRKGVNLICHRGSSEHAHENTLEAYRATFELGGDGNEFDIRVTKDGVLVVFHDDMLDHLLKAVGNVNEYTWEELQRFPFRNPGAFGEQCRIPTLAEVFELHRRYAGLMHLDIKVHGIDRAIAELLTRMDMWDQAAFCNEETGGVILRDPRFKRCSYKGGLYLDCGEVFPEAIAAVLKRPGNAIILEEPTGVALALGRKPGKLSTSPVSPQPRLGPTEESSTLSVEQLVAILRDAKDWNQVAETPADRVRSSKRIRARARAAEQFRDRSLHKDWMDHGFDGAVALRSLILLGAPNAVELARFTLWRDDPALEPVVDHRWHSPRSWTDFRVKNVVFPALEQRPSPQSASLCREYLALGDAEAKKIGPTQFEEAARALLAASPQTATALELMKHRLQEVRGRAILVCLAHIREPWALAALTEGAPFALKMRTDRD
jgi:Glycerophosphoryl diester phosphodiesterase family